MGGRSRRGLSPLVASIILIAFTIIGGFVVYEYFMSSSESVMAAGEGVIVNANTVYVSNSEKLVYLSGVNGHSGTITITQVKYYMPDGTPQTVDLSQNGGTITVKPGDKSLSISYYQQTQPQPHWSTQQTRGRHCHLLR
ncbi:archaellin/type IV pilin N-terminal domain-containing protein [Aeropyrum camini]|uniref:archaellin/type IV pilin N-terminal domain-containing protein n=1 Tax=Aeropyrum camini TaxID=229980 RepID=UPI0007876FB9|nr:archaellin/type IV pilin N-terminal domain-containing protein [Aeropyrum camini]